MRKILSQREDQEGHSNLGVGGGKWYPEGKGGVWDW